MRTFFIYILTNKFRGILYIGLTNDIARRIEEHRSGLVPGFTNKYNLKKLVYAEEFESVYEALEREKQLKRWHRKWKIQLIEKQNPNWKDLCKECFF